MITLHVSINRNSIYQYQINSNLQNAHFNFAKIKRTILGHSLYLLFPLLNTAAFLIFRHLHHFILVEFHSFQKLNYLGYSLKLYYNHHNTRYHNINT